MSDDIISIPDGNSLSENHQNTFPRHRQRSSLLRFYSLANEEYGKPMELGSTSHILGFHHAPSVEIPKDHLSDENISNTADILPKTKDEEIQSEDPSKIDHSMDLSHLDIFRPPRQEVDREAESQEKERSATWLELFYDIFYVSIIRILQHSEHDDPISMFYVLVRFITLWWSWMMVTLYDTKFDTDDLFHRTSKLIQMFALAGFAISIENCFKALPLMNTFTISYIVVRVTLLINYTLVYFFAFETPKNYFYAPHDGQPSIHHTVKRKAKRRAVIMMSSNVISILMFGLSIMVETPWARCCIWIASFFVDFAFHIWVTHGTRHTPFRGSHLPERMGLFTIIVLGECVIAVLDTSSQWVIRFNPQLSNSKDVSSLNSLPILETLLLSSSFIAICYSFWWMYFDDFCNTVMQYHRSAKRTFLYDRVRNLWIYLHLPVHTALAVMGMLMVDAINYVDSFRVKSQMGGDGTKIAETASSPDYYSYDGFLARDLFLWFGMIFFLNALIKMLNTYKNEAAYFDYIACIARTVFAVVLFSLMALPPSVFEMNPQMIIAPLVWLTLGIAILCIVEIGFDLLVQYLNASALRLTYTKSIRMQRTRRKNKAQTVAKQTISDPINAIPMHAFKE